MKIFKTKEISLLIKTFGIKHTLYLATTALIYFDLKDPNRLLEEQDLWSTIPNELGQGGILDVGMPKPRGEVLVTGKCFAPTGKTRTASEVSISVGSLNKRLSVFGERFWKSTVGMAKVITDPKPFTEMPFTWQNAFGGEGFDRNPIGKGIKPIQMPDGKSLIPLPNIEDPNNLIGSPSDRPEPVGFGPLDSMWPQRQKKIGTYDDKWLKERWPYSPDDMNYEFFNTASEDQFLPGFFKGSETIEILNMNPDIQLIKSHLPNVRVRCFVTKKKDLKANSAEDELFAEVKTRIDTVRLFPHILRGVVMYRGTTEVLDDEFADIVRIFLATEMLSEEPKSIEQYYEMQKKRIDRMVPLKTEPLEKAQEKIGKAMKRIKNLPKEIETIKLKAVDKAPRMPAPSPAEMKARAAGMVSKNMTLIAGMEKMAQGMYAKFGHLAKIDLKKFDDLRARLKRTEEQVSKDMNHLEEVRRNADASKKRIIDELKRDIEPEQLKKAGVDPDRLFAPEPINPWHDQGFPFIAQCRRNLEQDPETLNTLYRLGFDRRTIKRAWLGCNPEEKYENRENWGLKPNVDPQGRSIPLALPPGIVMPRFDDAVLNRILIRPKEYAQTDNDILIEGSDETPLFLPAATLIELPTLPTAESAPVVRAADELQALLVEQETGDACSVIALKDIGEKPDEEASKAIEGAPVFLVVLPEGEISESDWDRWEKIYPNARKLHLPKGSTVFEARKEGTDIRTWILEALPPEFDKAHRVEPRISKPGMLSKESTISVPSLSSLDLKGMIKSLMGEIKTVHQSKFDAIQARQKEVEERARAAMKEAGKDSAMVLDDAPTQRRSFAQSGEARAQAIAAERERLSASGRLTSEAERELKETEVWVRKMGQDAERQYQKGMSGFEKARNEAEKAKAGELLDKAKEKLKAAGLDPDRIRRRTREEVIEMHGRGESLSGAILSGVDLSELDLHGIDLSCAQCKKAKFCGSNLEGADFSQTIAQEADFTKASLRNMRAKKGIFSKALFKEANLSQADLSSATFQKADLTKANCTGARFYMTTLQKALLTHVKFNGLDADMCVFSDADASGADFRHAKLGKCLFKRTALDRADFSGATLGSTMFYEAKGEGVKFFGADMSKSRMGGKTTFPEADFRNVKMTQGCFRDSDLSGATFQGSKLELAMLENCDLRGADFYRVSAVKSRFAKSNLEGADMRGINLFQGSLRKARLVNTDLTGSNLFAVDLYKAVMGKTRLDKANLKCSLLEKLADLLPEEGKRK